MLQNRRSCVRAPQTGDAVIEQPPSYVRDVPPGIHEKKSSIVHERVGLCCLLGRCYLLLFTPAGHRGRRFAAVDWKAHGGIKRRGGV